MSRTKKANEVVIDEKAVRATACEAVIANAKVIGGVKFAEIPLMLLAVHPTVQRAPRGHERKIAAKWDRRKAGAVVVSYRDGVFHIIDGQHRYLAARMAGESTMTCQIYENLTLQDEARIFGHQSDDVKLLSTKELFRANVIAEEPEATALSALCNEYGIVVSAFTPTHGDGITYLTGLRSAQITYKTYGEAGLRFCFDIIEQSGWRLEKLALGKTMITALRYIYANHTGDIEITKSILTTLFSHITVNLLFAKATIAFVDRSQANAVAALLETILSHEISDPEKYFLK